MEIDLLEYEKELYEKGYELIAGTDEVGRGPLVGPVVAAAVILPKNYELKGLTDSKKLNEKKRNIFYDIIQNDAISVGVGIVSEDVIDQINILEASRLAMNIALDNLKVKPDYILSDAMKLDRDVEVLPIIHGDAQSITIAAASVIAKVTRDRMMEDLGKMYPEYEFERHKGYPTKRHIELVKQYGVLKEYRKTFKPINELVKESGVRNEQKETKEKIKQ